MQLKCGTKKVSTSITIILESVDSREISRKWFGRTQPNLVLVLLELTLGKAPRTIERPKSRIFLELWWWLDTQMWVIESNMSKTT